MALVYHARNTETNIEALIERSKLHFARFRSGDRCDRELIIAPEQLSTNFV